MVNIAAIKIEQHGGASNEKLKLEALVRTVGANLQAIFHLSNIVYGLQKLEIFERAEKLQNIQPIFLTYIH